jgi:hypothetical protein
MSGEKTEFPFNRLPSHEMLQGFYLPERGTNLSAATFIRRNIVAAVIFGCIISAKRYNSYMAYANINPEEKHAKAAEKENNLPASGV